MAYICYTESAPHLGQPQMRKNNAKGDLTMIPMRRREISEFLASFFLAFLGLGLLIPLNVSKTISPAMFNVMFGMLVAFDIIIFNTISGAQFNPSVTLAMVFIHRQQFADVVPYIVAQLLGWAAGTAGIYIVFWNQLAEYAASGAGNPSTLLLCASPDLWTGIWVEFILTALLLILILTILDKRILNNPGRPLFPFVVGAYITTALTFGSTYSGTAINPARDLAPRIVGLVYGLIHGCDVSACFASGQFIMYLIVPTLGAISGALFYAKVLSKMLPEKQHH